MQEQQNDNSPSFMDYVQGKAQYQPRMSDLFSSPKIQTPKHMKKPKLTKRMRKKLRNNAFVQCALDATHLENWRGKKILNLVNIGDAQYCLHPKRQRTLVRIR